MCPIAQGKIRIAGAVRHPADISSLEIIVFGDSFCQDASIGIQQST
jgi:hypothetical protein